MKIKLKKEDVDYAHCSTPHVAALALQALKAPAHLYPYFWLRETIVELQYKTDVDCTHCSTPYVAA